MTLKGEYFILSNGVKIPKIGFGTWQIPNGEVCYNSVTSALKNSYTHIDTAVAYGNEESVGKAIRDFKINRKDVFITTKVPAAIKSYQETKDIIEKSLATLDLEYIDLLLIHHAKPWDKRDSPKSYDEENLDVWKAMEEAYEEGKIKAIGVSNFNVMQLKNIMENSKIMPMVNQIRYFIGSTNDEIVSFCKENNILVEAYSPLATGRLLNNKEIENIALKYNKTLPQIAIRFCLENDVLPLPKSVHEDYIKANFDVNFKISKEDMEYLNSLKDTI
jgi:diketogulonate reductase-like aldo/keto reductase